jgi:hypothetical protein
MFRANALVILLGHLQIVVLPHIVGDTIKLKALVI